MELALGNYLTLRPLTGGQLYRFQNFHIGQTATFEGEQFGFMPFGFSGITVNRTGDNTEANLVFPNNELSRAWGVRAVNERWVATVLVMALNPDDRTAGSMMSQCVGQITRGEWDETSLTLSLSTVLDAVGSDFPLRRLTQSLVGNLPVTSNVRLR